MMRRYNNGDPLFDKYMNLLTKSKKYRAKKNNYFWFNNDSKDKRVRYDKKSRMHELSHLPRIKVTKNMTEFKKYFEYLSYSGKRQAKKNGWYWLNWNKRTCEINNNKFFADKAYVAAQRAINKYITIKWLDEQYQIQDVLQDCVLRIYELSGKLKKFDHNSIMIFYFIIAHHHLKKYWKKDTLSKYIGRLNESFGRKS